MVAKTLYKNILKPILYQLDPEFVHNGFTSIGELIGRIPVTNKVLAGVYKYNGPDISKTVDGITYKTPVLLAAGFDYNAHLTGVLDSMSFGGEEVGSVTAQPCEGNVKPRLTRAVKSQSIIVYKGLRNEGVQKIAERIQKTKHDPDFIVGVSIARSNNAQTVDIENGVEDYFTSLDYLVQHNVGDYYTVNISCPNSFGGESFAEPQRLKKLLEKLSEVKTNKPRYVKMPIILVWEEFVPLVDTVLRYGFQGVIIGNLNKNYDDLDYRDEAPQEYRGGLSGKPCQKLSNELIRQTRERYKKNITIIGCGGIFTPEDAMTKFQLGADLVQLITGMIFEGPHLMKEIATQYAQEFKPLAN